MGPGVRHGETAESSRSGTVGVVWRELGLHSVAGLLPDSPSPRQGSRSQGYLHSPQVGRLRLLGTWYSGFIGRPSVI